MALLTIEAIDEDGTVLHSAIGQEDGAFFMDNHPTRTLQLRISREKLMDDQAEIVPVIFELTADAPSVTSAWMVVKQR